MCSKKFRKSPSVATQNNIKYCSQECRNLDPAWHDKLIAMNLKQQSMKQSSIEVIGYGMLDAIGIEYIPQHLIASKFCVDAFVPALSTVIQFDGDYWHFNPSKFQSPDSRQKKRIGLDKSQDAYMKKLGYSVIRIWEHDIKHSAESVMSTLRTLLVPA